MTNAFWAISLIAAIVAGLSYWSGMAEADSAPKQAAVAAMAAAVAVIPYCAARAVSELCRGKDEE
jgi:outer membrane lipoprotein-sorting protein